MAEDGTKIPIILMNEGKYKNPFDSQSKSSYRKLAGGLVIDGMKRMTGLAAAEAELFRERPT